MAKSIPKWFERALKNIDSNLRVRWSYEKGKFIIEYKTLRKYILPPVKYIVENGFVKEKLLPELSDRYIQYKDGYYTVFYTDKLNEKVLAYIREIDTWGNKKKLSEEVEKIEKKEEERKEKEISEEIKAISREIWDYWNVRGIFNKGGII